MEETLLTSDEELALQAVISSMGVAWYSRSVCDIATRQMDVAARAELLAALLGRQWLSMYPDTPRDFEMTAALVLAEWDDSETVIPLPERATMGELLRKFHTLRT